MNSNEISDSDICGAVNRAINLAGSQRAFAEKAGVSPQALHRQLSAQTVNGFTDDVLRAAGLRRVQTEHYEFLEDAHV